MDTFHCHNHPSIYPYYTYTDDTSLVRTGFGPQPRVTELEGFTVCTCRNLNPCTSCIGLPINKGNVQTVLQKSNVSESKSWLKTLRCFSLPADDTEEDVSPSQKTQYLSESWLETEPKFQWWRLGMKLIRCCRAKEVETIQSLMMNVATYNHNSKSPIAISEQQITGVQF